MHATTYEVIEIAQYTTGTMIHVLAGGLTKRRAENLVKRWRATDIKRFSTFAMRLEVK